MMRESGDREASRSGRSWGGDDHSESQADSFKRDATKDRDAQRSGRRERSREREREKERERDRDRDHERERERERERDRSKTRTPDKDSREKNPKPRGREESKVKSGHHKPKIRWIHDDHLKKVKHYSIHDEPTADGLSEMKVREIRERQYREPSFSASTTVSRPSESSVKKLNGPSETIPWSKPKGVSRGEGDKIIAGEKSIEKAQHASRIVGKIPCYYAREYQIPDEPRRDPINSTQGGLKQVLRLKIQPFKDSIEETPELKKQSSGLESQVGENPNAKLSYLTEQCRRQLNKRVGKPSIKKPRDEQEEEDESEDSKYSGGGPDNETNWIPIAMFAGLLGLSFSDYRGYLGSLSRRCNKLDDAEMDRVKNNVDLIRNIFDLNSKVLSVNCNKAIEPNLGKRNSNGGLSKEQINAQIKNVNRNWRTKHCNKFHSDAGCGRGEACHFIHDQEYKGVPVPENKNSARPQGNASSQQNGYNQRSNQGYSGQSNGGSGYSGQNYQGQMRMPMQGSNMNYGPPRPPMQNGYPSNGGMMPRQPLPNDFQPRPPGGPYPPSNKS